jgi:hypothetical protein
VHRPREREGCDPPRHPHDHRRGHRDDRGHHGHPLRGSGCAGVLLRAAACAGKAAACEQHHAAHHRRRRAAARQARQAATPHVAGRAGAGHARHQRAC